jgi:hypothetical protein
MKPRGYKARATRALDKSAQAHAKRHERDASM